MFVLRACLGKRSCFKTNRREAGVCLIPVHSPSLSLGSGEGGEFAV
eukprot:COSAG06_NODE_4938_length_3846_cov_29.655006_1_plen_45_part_10